MGAFFTNIQVRADASSNMDRLLELLTERATGEGMLRVDPSAEADRSIAIVPGPRWIAIYDEATEDQGPALADLAAFLSQSGCSQVVSVLVHDSDVASISLYEDGACIDSYCSDGGSSSNSASGGDALRSTGKATAWEAAIAPGHSPQDLESCWNRQSTFAEDIVRETASLLGCPPNQATLGFNYLFDEPLPDGAIVLSFQKVRVEAQHPRTAERPKMERVAWGLTEVHLAVEAKLHLYLTCRNNGGPGTGLDVVVWGSAIAQGLVSVDNLQLVLRREEDRLLAIDSTPAPPESGRTDIVLAKFDDLSLVPTEPGLVTLSKKWKRAEARCKVHVNVLGKALKAGNGTLAIGFAPHDDPENGSAGIEHQIRVE
jgi:hypothetical protein